MASCGSSWGVESWDIVEAGDWQEMKEGQPETFRFTAAQYREMASGRESDLFLENKLELYRCEVSARLHTGAHIFVCGHRGMLCGVESVLGKVACEKRINYTEFIYELQLNGQWRAELYC